jgi:hypothetical protein
MAHPQTENTNTSSTIQTALQLPSQGHLKTPNKSSRTQTSRLKKNKSHAREPSCTKHSHRQNWLAHFLTYSSPYPWISMLRSLHMTFLFHANTQHRHCPFQEGRETENGKIGSTLTCVTASTEKSLECAVWHVESMLDRFDAADGAVQMRTRVFQSSGGGDAQ